MVIFQYDHKQLLHVIAICEIHVVSLMMIKYKLGI